MRSIEPGISRFRVRSFGPSRNDVASDAPMTATSDAIVIGGLSGRIDMLKELISVVLGRFNPP